MKNIILLLLPLVIWSTSAWSKEYQYEADVKGMVCAFCAYNVGKNISKLPGVIKETVDVDLKQGAVSFRSSKRVTQELIDPLFTKSGFTLSGLIERELKTTRIAHTESAILELNLSIIDSSRFKNIIKAIATIAAEESLRISIEAPAAFEMDILKSLLMGRQQVVSVEFKPVEQESIHLRLFDADY